MDIYDILRLKAHGGGQRLGPNLITDEVIASAYDNAWISSTYVWTSASNSASFAVPVTVGAYYKVEWNNTDSDVSGTIFRYGFTDTNTPGASNTLSTPRVRATPRDAQTVEVKASKGYMVIQVASGSFPDNVSHLSVREMIGYDPPVLLMAPPKPEPDPEE